MLPNIETLGETIAVFDPSGHVVSTSKQLLGVFKEAHAAYLNTRADIVDRYDAKPAPKGNQQVPYQQSEEKPRGSNPSQRDYFNSKQSSDAKNAFTQQENESVFFSPLSPEEEDDDLSALAYGEYHAETLERMYRNTEDDVEELMSKTQKLLMEAKCAGASAMATINHLQEHPEAMAAIALTLAEASRLIGKVGPRVIDFLKIAFPSAFALLACPQFLVAGGVGLGITIVMIGGYKIIKRLTSGGNPESSSSVEEDKQSMAYPAHLVDDFAAPPTPRPWFPPASANGGVSCCRSPEPEDWSGVRRKISRPSPDDDEVLELSSVFSGVRQWKPAYDAGRRPRAIDEEITAQNGGNSYFTSKASSKGSGSSYMNSKYTGSSSSPPSPPRHSPTEHRPRHSRRHDSGVSFDGEGKAMKDRTSSKSKKARSPDLSEPPIAEVDSSSQRGRGARSDATSNTRPRRSSSAVRRPRYLFKKDPTYEAPRGRAEAVPAEPSRISRPTHMLRRAMSTGPSANRASHRPPQDYAKPVEQRETQPPTPSEAAPVKGLKTAKIIDMFTLGATDRVSRLLGQSQQGTSANRSRSVAADGRPSRSEGRRSFDGVAPDERGSKLNRNSTQSKAQTQHRSSGSSAAMSWSEKRGKHERKSSKLSPSSGSKPHTR